MTLQFIHCGSCDKTWLVGIDGKKVFHSHINGGIFVEKPFMEEVLDVSEQIKCMKCGKVCEIQDTRMVK